MSENEIKEEAVEAAADTQTEATEEVKAEETSTTAEATTEESATETDEAKAESTPAEAITESATDEVKAESTPAEATTEAATEEVKAESTTETAEPVAAAPAEPEEEEEPEEISYHAVEKEGEITSIWEMQGPKHIRTISARSSEGTKILSLFTSEIHETDSPAMGNAAAETTA